MREHGCLAAAPAVCPDTGDRVDFAAMSTPRFLLYTALLVAGAALVGLVIGLVIKAPPASVASILIMVGLLLIALATLVAWTGEKQKTAKRRKT